MKRDLENLNLRNAFGPMPEATHDALMKAACSVEEEEPVRKLTFRTVLIAACIIVATMVVAFAATNGFGWTDFFKTGYDVTMPQTVQEIMQQSEHVTHQLGDVIFTVREQYSDKYVAMISTEAKLADGLDGILTVDDVNDSIGAYGDNSVAVAKRLGVDPSMTWKEAAKELNLPLYTIRAVVETPAEYTESESYEDPMFNEDGSLSYFSTSILNGKADAAQLDCQVYLRVNKVNLDDSEDVSSAKSERMNLSIALQPVTTTVEYIVPEETVIQDMLTLESLKAELTPSGLTFISTMAAKDGVEVDQAMALLEAGELISVVQGNGEEFPGGLTLSGGVTNLEQWPTIKVTQMVTANQIPETIHVVIPDVNGNDTMLVLQLKK